LLAVARRVRRATTMAATRAHDVVVDESLFSLYNVAEAGGRVRDVNGYRATYTIWWPQTSSVTLRATETAAADWTVWLGCGLSSGSAWTSGLAGS
jgi:hypothetical protein